jgi:hypothetical protein
MLPSLSSINTNLLTCKYFYHFSVGWDINQESVDFIFSSPSTNTDLLQQIKDYVRDSTSQLKNDRNIYRLIN